MQWDVQDQPVITDSGVAANSPCTLFLTLLFITTLPGNESECRKRKTWKKGVGSAILFMLF